MSAIATPFTQQREALVKANRVRTTRHHWKRDVAHGADPFPVLLDPPPIFEGMGLLDALLAIPRVGPTKAEHMMKMLRVGPTKTVGELTDRQRASLVSMLARFR